MVQAMVKREYWRTSLSRWRRRLLGWAAVLVVLSMANAIQNWWMSPIHSTTDAPPPTPLAATPPAVPSELIWSVRTIGEVAVAGGRYAVVVDNEKVVVRDLFTGSVRWLYKNPREYAPRINLIDDERMVVEFRRQRINQTVSRAFALASGRLLDVSEATDAILANQRKRPSSFNDCDPMPGIFDADLQQWVVLSCKDGTVLKGLDAATHDTLWSVDLPVVAAEFDRVSLIDIRYGVALVYAGTSERPTGPELVVGVDIATGEVWGPFSFQADQDLHGRLGWIRAFREASARGGFTRTR